jgi:hypothetical protein
MQESKCTHQESVAKWGFAPNPDDPDATPEQQYRSAVLFATVLGPMQQHELDTRRPLLDQPQTIILENR